MAQGDFVLFEDFAKNVSGYHDFVKVAAGTDTLSVILVSDSVVGMAATANPDRASFTEFSTAGGYTANGITLATPTWTESGGVATLDHNAGEASISWTAQAGSPTTIKTAILVNDAVASTYDAIGFIDLTANGGTTAISLVAGNITITWGASGILTVTV